MFPAARQMLERQKTHPSSQAQLSPGGKADAGGSRSLVRSLGGNPTCRRTILPISQALWELPSLSPCAPLAAGSGTGELSLSCALPGAPLGRCCQGSQRVRVEDSAGLVQPHLLFAASPSPAFGRLQVTASQGSLKVLCSHFLPLPPSPWIALNFQPFFSPKTNPRAKGSLVGKAQVGKANTPCPVWASLLSQEFCHRSHQGIPSVSEVWLMQ